MDDKPVLLAYILRLDSRDYAPIRNAYIPKDTTGRAQRIWCKGVGIGVEDASKKETNM